MAEKSILACSSKVAGNSSSWSHGNVSRGMGRNNLDIVRSRAQAREWFLYSGCVFSPHYLMEMIPHMCPKVYIPSDSKPHQINHCGLFSQTKICELGSFVFSTLNNSLTPARGSIVSSFYFWHSHSGLASNATEFNAFKCPCC